MATRAITADTITRLIYSGKFDKAEISQIANAIIDIRKVQSREAKNSLRVGAKVSFVSSRSGGKFTGKVIKINRTKAVIATDNDWRQWSVPFTMLKVEA